MATSEFNPSTFEAIGHNNDLRRRIFGVHPVRTTRANALFRLRMSEVFPNDAKSSYFAAADYDAFYTLAYASYALGGEPTTGPNLASAIRRLVPPGPPVDVGSGGILHAFGLLSAGDSIDLNGANGNLDFDVATGEQKTDVAITCIGADASGKANDNVPSDLVYAGRTGELTGHFQCR